MIDPTKLVHSAIDHVNQILPPERHVSKEPETRLFGEGGVLDSIGLVTLIVDLEARADEAAGVPISLTDERALTQKPSVFRTVGSLTGYVGILLSEATGG